MTGLSRAKALKLIERGGKSVKAAIVMHFRNVNLSQAKDILRKSGQSLRKAIKDI
jgi:N-acetylmuramic acid 6-phosphate (MurNAc-6-P) etherase